MNNQYIDLLNTYFVRLDDFLYCFYLKDNNIYFSAYENGGFAPCDILVANAKSDFSIYLAKYNDETIMNLYYQDINGTLKLGIYNSELESRVIELNSEVNGKNIVINGMDNESQKSLVFSRCNEEESFELIHRSLNCDNTWSNAQLIDKVNRVSIAKPLYYSQYVSFGHLLLFYSKKEVEFNIGYREMTRDRISGFKYIYKGTLPVVDYSFLTTNSAIHCIYVLKNMFSCKLFYRKKEADRFTKSIQLKELNYIDKTLIYINKNSIYVSYVYNNRVCVLQSDDDGESFYSVESNITNKFYSQADILKAYYLTNVPQEESDSFYREIYVEFDKPCNIVMPRKHLASFCGTDSNKKTEKTEVLEKYISKIEYEKKIDEFHEVVKSFEYQLDFKDKEIHKLKEIIEDKDYEISELRK